MADADLYTLTSDTVETPPSALGAALKRIGPGMVLAASIVGSGELIATTTLGAQVGYLALWIIVVSCAIKPVVQGELGRYTIATGETALEAFAHVPGPRVPGTGGRVNWLVACWLLTVLLSLLQVGGMFGGVAQVLNLLVPAISVNVWVGICLALTLALLLGGGYGRIEKLAVIKVSFFTILTVCAAAVLLWTPGAVSDARPRRRHGPALPDRRAGHRDRRLRHHRRRRHRAGHVPVLVHREGLRALHRPARRLGGVAAAGARLDPRDAPRHRLLAGHLHLRHARLLPAGRGRAAQGGPGARRPAT